MDTAMIRTMRGASLVTLFVALASPSTAQNRQGVMGDLLKDVTEVETRVVGLAKAMPDAAYQWRPTEACVRARKR
jgi:hypothetical protein